MYLRKRPLDLDNLLPGLGTSVGIGYEISSNFAVDLTLDYRRLTEQFKIERRVGPTENPEGHVTINSLNNVVTLSCF